VGSWVGCLYNSLPLETNRIEKLTNFFKEIFVPDDIKLFKKHLAQSHSKIKVIEIPMKYETLNYHWNYTNLFKGIDAGYQGTLEKVKDYLN